MLGWRLEGGIVAVHGDRRRASVSRRRSRWGWSPEALALQEKIRRRLQDLAVAARNSPYWVYVIRDPTTGDRRDWTTGDPIYVGQSEDAMRRAEQHLRAGGQTSERGPPLYRHMHRIMVQGRVPVFDLVEAAGTRLAALAAETRWALRFHRDGFRIYNDWPEHRDLPAGPLFGTSGVPIQRVWTLTLDEAEADQVMLAVQCPQCGLDLPLPVFEINRRCGRSASLRDVRAVLSCPVCGRKPCVAVRPCDPINDAGRT